jgi:hypothetical protein
MTPLTGAAVVAALSSPATTPTAATKVTPMGNSWR